RRHAHTEQPLAATGWLDQPEQHPDRGRLAGTVRAEEPVDGAARHGQVDSGDGQLVAEPLGQPHGGDGQPAGVNVQGTGLGFDAFSSAEADLVLAGAQAHRRCAARAYRPERTPAPPTPLPSDTMSTDSRIV